MPANQRKLDCVDSSLMNTFNLWPSLDDSGLNNKRYKKNNYMYKVCYSNPTIYLGKKAINEDDQVGTDAPAITHTYPRAHNC